MKPICVPCERFMRPKKNGLCFLEGMPSHEWDKGRGKNSVGWVPYKLWAGDVWHCPDCGAETIVGTGTAPLSIEHMDGFANAVERLGAKLMIKDC